MRDELERLRAAVREQLTRAEKVTAELMRIQADISEVLKRSDPDAPKAPAKTRRHR